MIIYNDKKYESLLFPSVRLKSDKRGITVKIALVAHDKKKAEMVEFMMKYEAVFQPYSLYATGTTGKRIMEVTNLDIHLLKSGPLGGDQQIGSLIAMGDLDLIFFFRDPLTAQPHEPDISALLRLCDVYGIPLATNQSTATLLVQALEIGWLLKENP
jgi:methylglyoxal synthase